MTETVVVKTVTKSRGWFSISTEGSGFGLSTKYRVTPKEGDKITLHLHKGSMIRGMDINGKKIYYKTDEDLDREHIQYLKKEEIRKEKQFKKNKPKLDAQYNKLPQCFKDRIDKFRKNNPNFRKEFESYEMFCCEQAIVIANALNDVNTIAKNNGFIGWLEYDLAKRFDAFKDLQWEDQKKLVPGLDDGHSGNTFGASMRLGYWYLNHPESVVKINGALANLVGSEEYGDIPKSKP